MKARESGMPDENTWEQFFDVEKILNELEIDTKIEKLVEFGLVTVHSLSPQAKRLRVWCMLTI